MLWPVEPLLPSGLLVLRIIWWPRATGPLLISNPEYGLRQVLSLQVMFLFITDLFITRLFITCHTFIIHTAPKPFPIHYWPVHYCDVYIDSKSYLYSLLLCSLLLCSLLVKCKHMSYTIWPVLFLFITALFITSPTSLNTLFIRLLVKRMSYVRSAVLFLFITALLIPCQSHVLYAAASPISIHYCSVHYLPSNTRLICGGKSYFYSLLLCSLLAVK